MTNHWPYVVAAYGLTGAGTLGLLLHSWLRMRSAERRVEQLRGMRGDPA